MRFDVVDTGIGMTPEQQRKFSVSLVRRRMILQRSLGALVLV